MSMSVPATQPMTAVHMQTAQTQMARIRVSVKLASLEMASRAKVSHIQIVSFLEIESFCSTVY